MRDQPAPVRRLLGSAVVAVALVGTAVSVSSTGDRTGSLASFAEARVAAAAAARAPAGGLAPDGHAHDHGDPRTKNAISRAGDASSAAQDPTTAQERTRNAAAVAAGRQTPGPVLTTAPAAHVPPESPRSRYAMANGCYALSTGDAYVRRTSDGPAATAAGPRRAEPFFLKPTELGTYLVYGTQADFLAGGEGVTMAADPSRDAEWRVRERPRGFVLRLDPQRYLAVGEGGRLLVAERGSVFRFSGTDGCTAYPEAQVDVSGAPFAGVTAYQEVRGYVDAHTHGMAFEFLGGGAHCGRPWHKYGAPYALVDCEDHQSGTNALEFALSKEPTHDPVGWPTFKDWPAPESLTHEGTYYRWLERSWRGGQRLFVNLLVENNQLCQLYPVGSDGTPLSKNSCDDMDSVALQAKRMHQFQDYVDAQWGGPGKGWYRIVTSPWQAREVINDGKMAVVMGIETSVPFGCTFKRVLGSDQPACDEAQIDEWLDRVRGWGVRQMELVNKFDNALSGVAGDEGDTGAAVNNANFLETGTYWDMQHCDPENPDAHDKNQIAAPEISAEQQDALFGAIARIYGATTALPAYPPPDHCNSRGLTALGEHVIEGLARRKMLFDPDHMSVKARDAALDQLEEMQYPGVLSSHSWSTEDAYPRIYELGGFIAPYAGDSTGFVEKWRKHLGWADPRFYFGFGYGADMNGLGAQGDPRGADVPNPVTYPFEGLGGVTVRKQRAGERVYDINVDGVAQYGLYPDWVEDLRLVAGVESPAEGDAIVEDMARGAEAYLQTWERATGIAPDSCRNPELRKRVSQVRDLVRPGMTPRGVMRAVGQPYTRVADRFTLCARTAQDGRVRMQVRFTEGGRVAEVRRLG